jgi:TM2 domain-containing membrane protein YozV
MNCAYHSHNVAVVNCNGCGKPLCPSCDHRVKGFPFCQDCIVSGVEMLRNHNQSNYAPFIKKQTSPLAATIFSLICPGLGAAYNGQTVKALVHFALFVGLFQMAILTSGTAIFVLGFLGMWLFAALDSWRTAQIIRSGITPDGAEDILVRRFSGNPKLWGIVLAFLGISFFLHTFFEFKLLMRGILPVLLIGLGIYLIRDYVFKTRETDGNQSNFDKRNDPPNFVTALNETSYPRENYETQNDFSSQKRVRNWKNR